MSNSTIQQSSLGPIVLNILKTSKTTTSTLTKDESGVILCTSSSAAYTISLPTANSMANIYGYLIKKTDDSIYAITIDANGSETIDGLPSYELTEIDQYVHLVSNGLNWGIVKEETVSSVWKTVPKVHARTDNSTLATTSDLRELIFIKSPLRYMISGTYYYGICTAITSSAISVAGAAVTSHPDQLAVGPKDLVYEMPINIPGTFGDGVADLVDADLNTKIPWTLQTAYLVFFGGYQKTNDSGSESKINIKIGSGLVSTDNSNNGISMDAAGISNSATGINTSNYKVDPPANISTAPTLIEVSCTVAGGSGDATHLSLDTMWVFADTFVAPA